MDGGGGLFVLERWRVEAGEVQSYVELRKRDIGCVEYRVGRVPNFY